MPLDTIASLSMTLQCHNCFTINVIVMDTSVLLYIICNGDSTNRHLTNDAIAIKTRLGSQSTLLWQHRCYHYNVVEYYMDITMNGFAMYFIMRLLYIFHHHPPDTV